MQRFQRGTDGSLWFAHTDSNKSRPKVRSAKLYRLRGKAVNKVAVEMLSTYDQDNDLLL